jgi:hypothetical protein
MRYFFHVQNGTTRLDGEGVEFPDLAMALREAVLTCGEMLREVPVSLLQDGLWCLWATDQPDNRGARLFTLTVSLADARRSQ